jgi:opacity protein-like surface antigen
MKFRSTLLAATILALPVVAKAQTYATNVGYAAPISGVYVGGGVGANFSQEQNTTITDQNLSGSGKFKFNAGPAAKLYVGYGFGNGFRAELEGNYRYNSLSGTNTLPLVGSLNAHGNEQKYAGMLNGLYDFTTLTPYVVPYIGVGVGYGGESLQGVNLYTNNGGARDNGSIAIGNASKSQFAVQAIAGVAVPITPALSLTAEYNFFVMPTKVNYSGVGSITTVNPTVTHTGFGSIRTDSSYNHTLLVGVRYAFGVTPPPVPVAAPAPAPAPARSYLVFFDWDKYNLTARAQQIIADAAANSKKVAYTKIESNGYTDTSGTAKYNMGLSIRRANAVAAELVKDGVPKNAIAITGFGETHPLVPTGDNVREPQNRRVEIIIK